MHLPGPPDPAWHAAPHKANAVLHSGAVQCAHEVHRLREHAAPSAQLVEKLSWRLSLVALAGVVALVLVYEAPQPKRDVHIEILRTKPAPVTVPGQAHAPSESTN